MPQHIIVTEYCLDWNIKFEREAKKIKNILKDNCTAIHHIGSTAVPGLRAKPIIDIMPVVKDIKKVDLLATEFEKIGYEYMGEFGIPSRRYLRKGGDERTHQIHIFESSNTADIERHLAVRDYLRLHEDAACQYGNLKEKLAEKFPYDIESYCDGKEIFMKELEQKALSWLREKQQEDRKVILFIAMSLDGYIADCNGGVDWINGHGNDSETIDTYSEFTKNIDTIIMGWNTYHQIITELSPTEWIYDKFKTYIITHRQGISSEQICFCNENPSELLKRIKKERGKNIWICGGAAIVQQLIQENLIDEYYISVIPTILGDGIPLFGKTNSEIKLSLKQTQNYNGIVELLYEKR